MTKLKLLATTALAATTIGVGGLVTAPAASALPRYTCQEATFMADIYLAHRNAFYAVGDYINGNLYAWRAEVLISTFC
jgi:hypothetical protein